MDLDPPDAATPGDDAASPPDAGGDGDASSPCVVGTTVVCTGPSGCQGTRTCSAGPDIEPCICRADCAPGTQHVYLLSTTNVLYSFDPPSLSAVAVGPLSCDITPSSMAIDRHGKAWVHSYDDRLFQVNITTAACTETAFKDPLALGMFGMGFVANSPGSTDETLYIGTSVGLGTIDTSTLKLSLVGSWNIGVMELTGTADARLFGFGDFVLGQSVKLYEINPKSGALLSATTVPMINAFSSFAMSFWGGDFYLFTNAQVTRYRPSDKTTKVVIPNLGVQILGAGVSTCSGP